MVGRVAGVEAGAGTGIPQGGEAFGLHVDRLDPNRAGLSRADRALPAPAPGRPPATEGPGIATDYGRRVYCIAGLAFDAVTVDGAAERMRAAAGAGRRLHLATPNLNIVRMARGDRALREAILASDLCVADGMPIVWLARLQGASLPGRAAGSDVFEALRDTGEGRRLRVHFFGGREGLSGQLAARLDAKGSQVACVGVTAPGFGDVASFSTKRLIDEVNASRPDLVAVSVSARKGLLWIAANERRIDAPLIANLGATTEFAAGNLRRAPPWMRRSGLEWLWRIREEPQLWSRYARDAAALALLGLQAGLDPVARSLGRSRFGPSALQVRHLPDRNVIALSGGWREADLGPLRETLQAMAGARKDLVIDLSGCAALDPAALGVLLLAAGHQARLGRRFAVDGAGLAMRLLLAAHGCGFLLARADGRRGRREPAPAIAATAAGRARSGA